MEKITIQIRQHLLSWMGPMFFSIISLGAGFLIALVLHYALYRMGLPSKPFIYAAF